MFMFLPVLRSDSCFEQSFYNPGTMGPTAASRLHLALTVNGEPAEAAVDPTKTLLEVLREDLQLTGTKHGCELGECGACAVLLDGEPVLSCLVLAPECGGREVVTVEGLVTRRPARPAAGDLRRPRRLAVRLLHAGHPDHGAGAARSRARIRRASGSARRCRATCAAAPGTCRSSRRSKRRGDAGAPARPSRRGTMSIPTSHGGVIGRARRRVDGRAKVTGQTKFADDLLPPRTVHCRLLRSTVPHGRIAVDRRVARPGDGRRAPGAHRRRLPDCLRHPAGEPGRAPAVPGRRPLRRRPGRRGRRSRRADRDRGARSDRRRLRGAAHLRRPRGQPADARAADPRLRRRGQRPQEGVAAVRRRRRGAGRRRPRLRRRVLLRGQHAPADRAARHGGGEGSGRQAGRLLEHADAALPAPRAGQGAGDAGGAHPGGGHAQRRRLRRQERSVQPRNRRRPRRADPRSPGEDLPDPRGGVPLPSRPASRADALPHRRDRRRQDHRPAPADAARRRRLRLLRRGQHLLHRRAADGHLPDPEVPLPGLPRLHQQAAVRAQARPRHAAEPLRPGGAARQDRRAAADRSRRPAAEHDRAGAHADGELPAGRHDRPGRVHPAGRRSLGLAREVGEVAVRARASGWPARRISPAPGCRSTGTTCRTRACS